MEFEQIVVGAAILAVIAGVIWLVRRNGGSGSTGSGGGGNRDNPGNRPSDK